MLEMDIYNTLLAIGMGQGILLTSALFIKNYDKRKKNPYFLTLLLLISVAIFSRLNFSLECYQQVPHIWFIADIVAYTIAPLWYFTIQKSIRPKIKITLNDYLGLAPALVHVAFLLYIFTLDRQTLLNTRFPYAFYAFCATVLIVNLFFFLKAHRTIKKNTDAQFPELLKQGQYLFLGILGIWILAFSLSFLLVNQHRISESAYDIAFLSLAFLMYGMGFLALVKPASFYFLTQTFDSQETTLLREIADKINNYLQEKRPYLKPNFTISQLAQEIQVNSVLTSKAINRILKTSFSDLINEYRVRHFVRMVQEEQMKNLTHWAVAQQAGFGNKVSFYKAFKKIFGSTPKEYLKTLSSS